VRRSGRRVCVVLATLISGAAPFALAQDAPPPALRTGGGAEAVRLDGLLNEPAWTAAQVADGFAQTDPREGASATFPTTVRVLAGKNSLVIGIVCSDDDPAGIVSFNVRRDAPLGQEDHVRVVIGPFQDGRSGYVFAVNPNGARYDGVVNASGENENSEWDGIWEAETARSETGWSAEIRIPIQTLSFKPGLREWHFNVERRVQRLQEVDRWASPVRQYRLTQTSRAGLLTGIPDFALGRGLSLRPSITTGGGIPSRGGSVAGEFRPSLDVTQRLGSNVTASFTSYTDFAETEVDTRQTNLTRFPLFFPEKRTFFLEGVDIFQFGPVVNNDMIPYFSRRIGLVGGKEVPILAGAKVNGRVANTNFGGIVVSTDSEPGVVAERTTMAVARVKQNLWRESYVGFVATAGDPLGRSGSWLSGVDFTYSTSSFLGNKNFSINAWGVATGRDGLRGDTTASAFKIDYPNDKWDMRLWYRRIGRDFDPSLGFVPRRAFQRWNPAISNRTRFTRGPIQDVSHGVNPYITLDLGGRWESYDSPVQSTWRFRSGDRVQVVITPAGDRPTQLFQISPGVVVAPGSYTWVRRGLGLTTAQKRRLSTSLTWTTGSFYDGDLTQWDWTWVWNPTALYTVELSAERNDGDLVAGHFTQNVIGTRLRINLSPDLSIASYAQYDSESKSVGINSRLRWTFLPVADLFVVYNHNVKSLLDRWALESNQLLVKLQYAWRM
jgi:Domain of unknown function (DUF5916)